MENPQQSPSERWAFRFFTIWTGQAFSLFGSALVQFALVWWLTQKTGSAVVLTMATLAGMLPQIVLGPFAGALVDRWNRRRVMIAADAGIAAFTVLLIYLFASDRVEIWHIYLIMAVRSLGGAFHFPAMGASTPLMVPEKHLTRINGLNQTLRGLIDMTAAPIGALLISVMPTAQVLMIDIVTAGLAILPLLFFSIPQPAHLKDGPPKTSLLTDIREGMRFISKWPGLVSIMVMAFLINFLVSPTASLTPLLVLDHFKQGALQLGFLDSAFGLGVIIGGLLLGVWGGFKKKVVTSMFGLVGMGLGIGLIGLAPSPAFWMAIVGYAFTGFMNPLVNGPFFAILQTIIPQEMQGRVMALLSSGSTAMIPLGLIIAGPLSELMGIRSWFWIAGLVTLLMGAIGFFVPAIMNLEEQARGTQNGSTPSLSPSTD